MRADLLEKALDSFGRVLGLLYTGVMDYCGEEIIIVWRVEGYCGVDWMGVLY